MQPTQTMYMLLHIWHTDYLCHLVSMGKLIVHWIKKSTSSFMHMLQHYRLGQIQIFCLGVFCMCICVLFRLKVFFCPKDLLQSSGYESIPCAPAYTAQVSHGNKLNESPFTYHKKYSRFAWLFFLLVFRHNNHMLNVKEVGTEKRISVMSIKYIWIKGSNCVVQSRCSLSMTWAMSLCICFCTGM